MTSPSPTLATTVVVDGAPVTSSNPLREGLRLAKMPEPCVMVICGATGDLTERKLGPALYNLLLGGFLPPEFTVVGNLIGRASCRERVWIPV